MKNERIEQSPSRENKRYKFDVVVVLGGGVEKYQGKFHPTDYRHGDAFGMLGGGMRNVAAVDLYLGKQAKTFLFASGVSEKSKEKFGPDVPPESRVYGNKFERSINILGKKMLADGELEKPEIFFEEKSRNTLENVEEVLKIIKYHGWSNVAIVSSDYHIPRIEALYRDAIAKERNIKLDVSFISAELLMQQTQPGKYDNVIERYYHTDGAAERIKNEKEGLRKLTDGAYSPKERLGEDNHES